MSYVLIPVEVIVKLFTLSNGLLGYWAVGNTLTGAGESLLESLAVIIQRSAYVFAVLMGLTVD